MPRERDPSLEEWRRQGAKSPDDIEDGVGPDGTDRASYASPDDVEDGIGEEPPMTLEQADRLRALCVRTGENFSHILTEQAAAERIRALEDRLRSGH